MSNKKNEERKEMLLPAHYVSLNQREKKTVREEYISRQRGLCWRCLAPLLSPPSQDILGKPINWSLFPGGREGFLRYPVHLHHDHTSGFTLGAVHAQCNAFLWQYEGQ